MSSEARARKIVVEAIIPAPVEVVWERSQVPEQHTAWDIRFNHIGYIDKTDDRGYHLMDYRTNVALGITINGHGRYLANSSILIPASNSIPMIGSQSSATGAESGCTGAVPRGRCSKPCTTTTCATVGLAGCWMLQSFAACCNWRPNGFRNAAAVVRRGRRSNGPAPRTLAVCMVLFEAASWVEPGYWRGS